MGTGAFLAAWGGAPASTPASPRVRVVALQVPVLPLRTPRRASFCLPVHSGSCPHSHRPAELPPKACQAGPLAPHVRRREPRPSGRVPAACAFRVRKCWSCWGLVCRMRLVQTQKLPPPAQLPISLGGDLYLTMVAYFSPTLSGIFQHRNLLKIDLCISRGEILWIFLPKAEIFQNDRNVFLTSWTLSPSPPSHTEGSVGARAARQGPASRGRVVPEAGRQHAFKQMDELGTPRWGESYEDGDRAGQGRVPDSGVRGPCLELASQPTGKRGARADLAGDTPGRR